MVFFGIGASVAERGKFVIEFDKRRVTWSKLVMSLFRVTLSSLVWS